MARYTDGILPTGQTLRLSLDRYQELMRLPEASFNGIYRSTDESCYDCAQIWKQYDRDAIAIAIGQAEEMRESELGYHLAPVYLNDEEYDYDYPMILKRKHLIEIGEEASSDISLAAALTLSVGAVINDPVVLTVATTVTSTSEIKVYYPGEDVEIRPSSISISGGVATINIPRSRLLDPDIDTNCTEPNYDDDSNFITTVDVKRVYNNVEGAYFVWFGDCAVFCNTSFTETTQLAYPRITDTRLSVVEFYPATHSGTTWSSANWSKCCYPCRVRVSYKSGRQSSVSTELLTSRLAHTLLSDMLPKSQDPCADCYKDDRIRDASELITPYGTASGAIKAWMADSRAKIGQGSKFPRVRSC